MMEEAETTTMEEDDSMMMEEEQVNSFEAFWPLVAGKTKGDTLYPLKRFKETARGWAIFGPTQKADYEIFLGTKRVLEAEKLILDNKTDHAISSLNSAGSHLQKAQKNLEKALEKDSSAAISEESFYRLQNLSNLINQIGAQSEGLDAELEAVNQTISSIIEN